MCLPAHALSDAAPTPGMSMNNRLLLMTLAFAAGWAALGYFVVTP